MEAGEEVELAKHAQKGGETQKTSVKSVDDLSDRDEMELVFQGARHGDRNQYGV